ncbi:hypothetical protein [Cupriavidus pinatubonensis]|uniref:hypothetical protein n=1 Tax=Cupriavidus pinatubonensis TaxID=248026 RepID=UPI001126BF42|nr:hypothetical protein [Cupriavidus pinatubonensis]TPQ31232.1 hypothetical protein C2U69_29495 [Cupriavidus pinatubonensis]
MSNVKTSICAVDALEVGPVTFQGLPAFGSLPRHTFATQTLQIALENGGSLELVIHLREGCNSLVAGDPVAIPRDISEEDAK